MATSFLAVVRFKSAKLEQILLCGLLNEWRQSFLAPNRGCSWQGHFPEADKDPVIQIANIVTVQGAEQPIVRNVMTLDTCAPIVGAEVMSFSSEDQLLRVRGALLPSAPCQKQISSRFSCCSHSNGHDLILGGRARGNTISYTKSLR